MNICKMKYFILSSKLLLFLFVKILWANDMTLFGLLPAGSSFSLETGLLSAPLLRVECRRRGRAWRTSDRSAAASSPHQMQADPQIDVQTYAPDRILERTFPPPPGRPLHHVSSLWKDTGKR